MHCAPMLQVSDVEATSRWYQQVVGLVSGHGGPDYEMLFGGAPFAAPLALQLQRWDAHEHGIIGAPDAARGHGVSLWFEVSDERALEAAFRRAGESGATVLAAPAWNPQAHHHELSLRDPDGYVVVLCTPFEAAGP